LLLSRRSREDILLRRASPSGLWRENRTPRNFRTRSQGSKRNDGVKPVEELGSKKLRHLRSVIWPGVGGEAGAGWSVRSEIRGQDDKGAAKPCRAPQAVRQTSFVQQGQQHDDSGLRLQRRAPLPFRVARAETSAMPSASDNSTSSASTRVSVLSWKTSVGIWRSPFAPLSPV